MIGGCPGLRATDYKDPPKILEVEMEQKLIMVGNVNRGVVNLDIPILKMAYPQQSLPEHTDIV